MQPPKKSLLAIIVLTTSLLTHNTWCIDNTFKNYITKEHLITGALCLATAFITGKIIHHLYHNYFWSHNRIVNNCRTIFKKTYELIVYNKNMYHYESQLSDWDLKATIYEQNHDNPYPFISYYSSLTQALYSIEQQIQIIQQALNRLHKHKQKLTFHNTPRHAELLEMFTRLEIQGTQLEAHLQNIKLIMISLKYRIALFKEYNDDYHNWIYEQKRKTIEL